MTEEFNKSIIRRIWKDVWQDGNLAVIDELVDVNHILHAYPEDLDYGSGAEGYCFCNQYSYSHSNSHKYTNTLIINHMINEKAVKI